MATSPLNATRRPPGLPDDRLAIKQAPGSATDRTPAQGAPSLLKIARAGDSAPYRIDALPAHVASRIAVDPESGCWIWTGRLDNDGYGRLGGRLTHRIVYVELAGPIPDDRPVLDHREDWGCISRACCLPAHVKPSTVWENTRRGRSFSAVNARKFECVHQHPFDFVNTYIRPDGARDCRQCIRDRVKRYRKRQRRAETVLRSAA